MKAQYTIAFAMVSVLGANAEEPIKNKISFNCEMHEMDGAYDKSIRFSELQNMAKLYAIQTCKNMKADLVGSALNVDVLLKGTDELQDTSGRRFSFMAELYNQWRQSFPEEPFDGMESLSRDFAYYKPKEKTDISDFPPLHFRKLNCGISDDKECALYLEFRSSRAELSYKIRSDSNSNKNRISVCKKLGFTNCESAFVDFKNAIDPYNYYISLSQIDKVQKTLSELQKDWDDFSENSRYQTFIDKYLTTEIYHKEFNGIDWAGPPKYQYFLLHPGLVVDHFSTADAGDQTNAGLSVEWIGINKWSGSLPVGVSLTSVYADRESGDRVGHGLMFHIKNDYSVGIATRGHGDFSVFVNLNFSNWIGTQQNKYEAYKDKMGKLRSD